MTHASVDEVTEKEFDREVLSVMCFVSAIA